MVNSVVELFIAAVTMGRRKAKILLLLFMSTIFIVLFGEWTDNEFPRYLPNDTCPCLANLSSTPGEKTSMTIIPCNYTRAAEFEARYGRGNSLDTALFREKVRMILSATKQALDTIGIPFWLDGGTCLGWFRQCDVIAHTSDVDIGIFIEDYNVGLVTKMEDMGFMLVHIFGKVCDSLELSFVYDDIKLDVFFFYPAMNHTWNGSVDITTGEKFKYIYPQFKLCWTTFLGVRIRVPCAPESYILASFGTNWGVPTEAWTFNSSPHNMVGNGWWPRDEWDRVMQIKHKRYFPIF